MPTDQPVICAFEGSEASGDALLAAAWLARSLGAPLELTHVFDPQSIPARPREEMIRESITDADLEQDAREAAQRLVDIAARAVEGVELRAEVAEGDPVNELRRIATEHRALLTVAGTAGRAGLDLALQGSVAGDLAIAMPCPLVVIARGDSLEEPGPVVAACDGSGESLRAAAHAAALATGLDRELVLVHVARPGGDQGPPPDSGLIQQLSEGAARGRPSAPGHELRVRLAAEEGDPVQVVGAVAREQRAAIIFTGTRGRGALSAAVLGSVSSGLVRTAGRPVAIVGPSASEALPNR